MSHVLRESRLLSESARLKVIYVSFGRLTDKFARDWYIDYLIGKGVSVEYWDIVAVLREAHSERGALNPSYLLEFRTFADIEAALQRPENRNAIYVMLITYAGRFTRIFRLLSKYDCRMVTFAWGALPRDPVFKWRKAAAWLLRPHLVVKELVSRFKANSLRRLNLVKPFEITFAAGSVSMASAGHAVKVVAVNYFDYDHYLQVLTAAGRSLVAGRYAVFLDINLPHHSDLGFLGYRRIDPSTYYRSLNRFFDLLEREHGIEIVIAAHPRADYDDTKFEGRRIFRLLTAELVKDAEFVISHTSTAMSYAVLNLKPIVFIYTDDMAARYEREFVREIRCYAEYLNASICNVDEVKEARQLVLKPADASRYQRYKYNFLTSPQSEGTPTQEIFWRQISTC